MGLSLDTALQIAGYRASVFRDGLRSYMRSHSRANMLDLKSVFPHRKDGAIMLEECLDRGLFDGGTPAITPAGETIARAKVTARTPLAKAKAVLDSFLERVENHENDPDAVTQVEEIWLFGSVLRGEDTVGDIDLAMSTARKEMFRDNHDERYSHVEVMLQRYGKELATREDPWVMEERLTRFRLFGDRRHPLLAGVQTGFMDLASLGVPCRLIYDRKRGGRVDDPVLPRHPTSEGRSAEMDPPPSMPDLTPAPIRPMDARWLAAFCRFGSIVPHHMYRQQYDAMHAVFSEATTGLFVFTDGIDPKSMEWLPERAKRPGLDGRNAALLISADKHWGTSLVLNRHMDLASSRWTLRVSFDEIEFHRFRRRANPAPVAGVAAVLALTLATDAERMLRRAAEADGHPAIVLSIATAGLGSELGPVLLPALLTALERLLAPSAGPTKGLRPGVPPAWHRTVDMRVIWAPDASPFYPSHRQAL